MDEVSKRFRKWRGTMGLTLDEVTEAVNRHLPPGKGVGRSTVNNYEARTEPSLAFLRALKKAYPTEVHVEWFMFGEVKKTTAEGEVGGVLRRVVGIDTDEAYTTFGQAGAVIEEFLADLILQYAAYQEGDTVVQSLSEPSEKMKDLYERVRGIFKAPLEAPEHFATLDELTAADVTNYGHAIVAAIRPLLRVVRRDRRSAKPAHVDDS